MKSKRQPHSVLSEQTPVQFADRIGQQYAMCVSEGHKKRFGQFLTRPEVARFMANLSHYTGSTVHILDPGAGTGILACALCEALAQRIHPPQRILLEAIETDIELIPSLRVSLEHTQKWLEQRHIALEVRIFTEDFILSHADALSVESGLFAEDDKPEKSFDIIIANPPYFKIPKSDPRARAARAVVHGQPNIYALFMAIAASLLKPNGELICITPRSFASGLYFRLFREHFFALVQPEHIHVFHSRKEAFREEEVLQENIILRAVRKEPCSCDEASAPVCISSSIGTADLTAPRARSVPLSEILTTGKDKTLNIPAAEQDSQITSLVKNWSAYLHSYGLAISTGPVVPFRAMSYISEEGNVPATHTPLLWMQHVLPMCITWPLSSLRKPQTIRLEGTPAPLLIPNRNYVLLRRFSSKEQARRLIAAPYIAEQWATEWLSLENHLNYIYRPGGELTEEEAYGLAALLNSVLLDTYFRISNGNTQVNATEIRVMPLPAREIILAIGRRCSKDAATIVDVDRIVNDVLDIDADIVREERARYVAD